MPKVESRVLRRRISSSTTVSSFVAVEAVRGLNFE